MTCDASRLGSSQRLVTGYNHNIPYGGVVYHVQTEFYPGASAHVDTHVFDDGRVVGSHRSDLDLDSDVEGADGHVLHVMKTQQKEMIRRLVSGRLDTPDAAASRVGAKQPTELRTSTRHDVGASETHSVANLELRRSLIRFVRAVQPYQTPDSAELVQRLRSVITTTAMILGRHVYDNSRHEELAELLILRSEGLDWLRSGADDLERGHRIWTGFAKIARQFARLNQRRELVVHDLEVWERVTVSLDGVPDGFQVESDIMESLRSTWGRDEMLDRLLEFPVGLDVGTLRRAIEGARAQVPGSQSGKASSSRDNQGAEAPVSVA